MKKYKVVKYRPEYFKIWNNFVDQAKNATFLFHRNFMEYHADRFTDFSLLVFDEKENLKAILPANIVGDTVFSHQGLTYGGMVLDKNAKLINSILIFKSILFFLNEKNVKILNIKLIPDFYTNSFSGELIYCLSIVNAKIVRTDCLSTIDLTKPNFISKTRMQTIKKGEINKLEIKEEENFELFWSQVLLPSLNFKHQVKPVHSSIEIKNLQKKFPENIRHFNVYFENNIVAGTTVFVNKNIVHSQYISSKLGCSNLGSLDFLYYHLITNVFKNYSVLDFGISNEDNGKKINKGLLFWKESFGAKTVTQQFYEIETKNYTNLETVLV